MYKRVINEQISIFLLLSWIIIIVPSCAVFYLKSFYLHNNKIFQHNFNFGTFGFSKIDAQNAKQIMYIFIFRKATGTRMGSFKVWSV